MGPREPAACERGGRARGPAHNSPRRSVVFPGTSGYGRPLPQRAGIGAKLKNSMEEAGLL